MLRSLSIREIVLISALELDFGQSMTVLTGETGAGKSILLDALALAIGARGDGSLVRKGAKQGQITAVFDTPILGPAATILAEQGIETDGDLILRRVQSADGRTKAYINDQQCGVALLRQLGRHLVEIHGQHDDRALIDPASHQDLLDAYGALDHQAVMVRDCHRALKDACAELTQLEEEAEAARREEEFLIAAVEELTHLNPEPDEEAALAEKRQRLMQMEKVIGDIDDAFEVVGGDASPIPALSSMLRRLERKAPEVVTLFDKPIEGLSRAIDDLEEVSQCLTAIINESTFDSDVLETTETRLFALRAAARKFDVQVDNLPELVVKMADQLALLEENNAALKQIKVRVAQLEDAYCHEAGILSQQRQAASERLAVAVNGELPALKLERASFIVRIDSDESRVGPDGFDNTVFWVRTNPGSDTGPIVKVASGGELSRFLLALKVSLAHHGSAPTLIFDEIDSGVGGAVADAMGERLSNLADTIQVLAITHAPQVAARARHHFLISKSDTDSGTVQTEVRLIEEGARQEEVARMLAGRTVTKEARAAAARLLHEEGR